MTRPQLQESHVAYLAAVDALLADSGSAFSPEEAAAGVVSTVVQAVAGLAVSAMSDEEIVAAMNQYAWCGEHRIAGETLTKILEAARARRRSFDYPEVQ